jgi:hypothetical protein
VLQHAEITQFISNQPLKEKNFCHVDFSDPAADADAEAHQMGPYESVADEAETKGAHMTNSRVGKYAFIAALVLNASNAQAQSALGVYDATNKFVGNLVDNQLVGVIINGTVAALPFDVEGLQEGNGVIFFDTEDCQGWGYLGNQTLPPLGYYAGDNTIYYAKQPPKKVMVASYWFGNYCYALTPMSIYVGLAKSATIPHFKPPFTVR